MIVFFIVSRHNSSIRSSIFDVRSPKVRVFAKCWESGLSYGRRSGCTCEYRPVANASKAPGQTFNPSVMSAHAPPTPPKPARKFCSTLHLLKKSVLQWHNVAVQCSQVWEILVFLPIRLCHQIDCREMQRMIQRTLQLDVLHVIHVEIKTKECQSGCIVMRQQDSTSLCCVGYEADTILIPFAIFWHLGNPEVQMEITGNRFAQSNLGKRIDSTAVWRNEYAIRVNMLHGHLVC
nr:MAG TPA: hypothetical protein [Caudoviricetes sp.]